MPPLGPMWQPRDGEKTVILVVWPGCEFGGGDPQVQGKPTGNNRRSRAGMKVLVTGGAGYLGPRLTTGLLSQGTRVCVFDLRQNLLLERQGRDVARADLTNKVAVANGMREIEVVYHLTWCFCPGDLGREAQEGLFAMPTLLEAARAAGAQHLVFASSAVVYGPTGQRQVAEEHPRHPEATTIGGPVCGITKLACEKYCLAYHRQGLPVKILRMHRIFSEGYLASSTR